MIIAFTGRIASGKGYAGKYLARLHGAFQIDYSESLHEALSIIDIPETRDNLQMLSQFLRSRFGADTFQRAVLKKIQTSSNVLISLFGIRRIADFQDIKMQFPFFLVYIDSDFDTRFKRNKERNQRKKDNEMSKEQFRRKDEEEPEFQIESLKPVADFIVENNGTLEEFSKKLESVFQQILQDERFKSISQK